MFAGFGAGAALMATGVVLWLLTPSEADQERQTTAAAVPTQDGQGMVFSITGRW